MELFSYLAKTIASINTDPGKQVITTLHSEVISNHPGEFSSLAPCNHEEADTRIFLHLENAITCGHTKVLVRTVDTDVVVLAVTAAQRLNLSELWVAFGTGKGLQYLLVHEIAKVLGPERCKALPMFHAITGCDTVSSFAGRGEKLHGKYGKYVRM